MQFSINETNIITLAIAELHYNQDFGVGLNKLISLKKC